MDIKELKIDQIELSVRVVNALHRSGIFTVEEMLPLKEKDITSIRNLGRKSIDEIMGMIRKYSSLLLSEGGSVPVSSEPVVLNRDTAKKQKIEDSDLSLSVRAINGLKRADVLTIGDLIVLTEDDLINTNYLGEQTVDEILGKIAEYRKIISELPEDAEPVIETIDPAENFDEWIKDETNQRRVIEYLMDAGIGIDSLELLSVKAYNLLLFAGYSFLHQIIFLDSEDLGRIPRMDGSSAAEIYKNCRYYIRHHMEEILAGVGVDRTDCVQSQPAELSVYDIIRIKEYREAFLDYVKVNDLRLTQLDLSVRTCGALSRDGHIYLSDIILKSRSEFYRIKDMGARSVDEISRTINDYLERHQDRIVAYVNGDRSVLFDEVAISEKILKTYQEMGFKGLHFPEIIEKIGLPEDTDPESIKRIVGKLISDGKLEYVDFLVFRVYPSFFSYIKSLDDEKDRGIRYVQLKLNGETLESIAQDEGLTRERVRQVIKKTGHLLRNRFIAETGFGWFDEDYYQHLFENYALGRKLCIEWLGIPNETYNYLDMFYTKGKRDISEAPSDPDLEVGLKLKISNYINRNNIFIDGSWIERKRSSLEEYVIMRYCADEITFDDFIDIYNGFLAEQGIPYSEELYYTVDIARSRSNRLSESRYVLWKQFQKIRYYDIDAQDYSELLDTLNLDAYENTELSVLTFFKSYPDLMARYDIRDQYELHNLIRKIIPEGSYHDFRCGRTPIICFGQFDRTDAILDLLINNAPISQTDLVELIHQEYGYDKTTIAGTYLQDIKEYYHMGMYTIDSKVMPYSHKDVLRTALTEDFYYVDEVKRIYLSLIPNADSEMINPYNLKSMGFTVLSRCILQNWSSIEAYFKHFLLNDDIVDITPLRKRFCYVHGWSQTLSSLKNEYEVLEFEPNHIINIRRLKSSGVSKQDLRDFCDAVYRFLPDDEYFTAKSLRKSGFDSTLYELGFSDWFYANLLCADTRFSYCSMMSSIVLHKGKQAVSIKSFLIKQIKTAGKIDIIDLMNDLEDDFGCNATIKSDITGKLQGSEIFYDPILERLYANAELYYRELDEDTEAM